MVTNLVFPYSGRGFTPLVPVLESIYSRGVGRDIASEDHGKKVVGHLSLLLMSCYQFASLAHCGGVLSLTFLADIPVETLLLFLVSLAKFSSSCALAILTLSLHNWAASLDSSQDTCPCCFFFF